jgi:hypothetical protein
MESVCLIIIAHTVHCIDWFGGHYLASHVYRNSALALLLPSQQ